MAAERLSPATCRNWTYRVSEPAGVVNVQVSLAWPMISPHFSIVPRASVPPQKERVNCRSRVMAFELVRLGSVASAAVGALGVAAVARFGVDADVARVVADTAGDTAGDSAALGAVAVDAVGASAVIAAGVTPPGSAAAGPTRSAGTVSTAATNSASRGVPLLFPCFRRAGSLGLTFNSPVTYRADCASRR